ncbi:MAG TPA: hypothetical protein VJB82_02575 [Candidatus Peribacterales bacterium]|nr:hypothetical protein [Candidatus Peribacterales bacterium]
MNRAESFITYDFHDTVLRAHECIQVTPHDADMANDHDLLSVQEDVQWAIRMVITEAVLLQAFKETEETMSLETEGLIVVADRKISNPSFILEIMEYLQNKRDIPQCRSVDMQSLQFSIRRSFNEVCRYLREGMRRRKKSRH